MWLPAKILSNLSYLPKVTNQHSSHESITYPCNNREIANRRSRSTRQKHRSTGILDGRTTIDCIINRGISGCCRYVQCRVTNKYSPIQMKYRSGHKHQDGVVLSGHITGYIEWLLWLVTGTHIRLHTAWQIAVMFTTRMPLVAIDFAPSSNTRSESVGYDPSSA